jgi:hypothetical protein
MYSLSNTSDFGFDSRDFSAFFNLFLIELKFISELDVMVIRAFFLLFQKGLLQVGDQLPHILYESNQFLF